MSYALQLGLLASFVLVALVHAAQPGELLAFLGRWWQAWLIHRPKALPDKPTGTCSACTAFWWVGVPLALLAGLVGPAGWWAVGLPFVVFTVVGYLLP